MTLTIKQGINSQGYYVPLDEFHARGALKHAFNIVDRKLFGARFRKRGRLQRIAVYEGGDSVHFHYHLAVDVPDGIDPIALATQIWCAWRSTQWGDEIFRASTCDEGWADYITKLSTKADFGDSIDWQNTVLGVPSALSV